MCIRDREHSEQSASSIQSEAPPSSNELSSLESSEASSPANASSSVSSQSSSSQAASSYTPPEEYDPTGILNAWRTGDHSTLSARNASILSACEQAINEVILDSMTDYEKELAIHDWIIQHAHYCLLYTSRCV